MSRVVHFEIFADDPERASAFYTKVFGWAISKWPTHECWYIKTGEESEHGINGGIMKREKPLQAEGFASAYVCTINVPNLDDCITKVTELGGCVAVQKSYLPGIGYLVYCKDTEGNMFGIMQDEKK